MTDAGTEHVAVTAASSPQSGDDGVPRGAWNERYLRLANSADAISACASAAHEPRFVERLPNVARNSVAAFSSAASGGRPKNVSYARLSRSASDPVDASRRSAASSDCLMTNG